MPLITSPLPFLSTLSLRRATAIQNTKINKLNDFYPRSPCGERHLSNHQSVNYTLISIHALLAESDNLAPNPKTKATEFLSTLSLRRATLATWQSDYLCGISIHALLAESDRWVRSRHRRSTDFYPRSPCGERRCQLIVRSFIRRISIHALLAESDLSYYFRKYLFLISIHALLAESDVYLIVFLIRVALFLSTLSLRRATHNRRVNLF